MLDRISYLRELIRDDPGDPFLPYALALELIKTGEQAEANRQFNQVIDQFPEYLPVYYHAAQLKIQMAQPEDASRLIEKGKELAMQQRDMKTFNELNSLLHDLDDE